MNKQPKTEKVRTVADQESLVVVLAGKMRIGTGLVAVKWEGEAEGHHGSNGVGNWQQMHGQGRCVRVCTHTQEDISFTVRNCNMVLSCCKVRWTSWFGG